MKTKLTEDQKTANKLARKEAKETAKKLAKIDAQKMQRPVKEITISIEWKKSRMWGYNPIAEAIVIFQDGSRERSTTYTASGCGYDKESTVIGQAFNDYMLYKLWNIPFENIANSRPTKVENPAPYGIHAYSEDSRSYGQGIGANCYYKISEHVANGKSFDVYKYTDGI